MAFTIFLFKNPGAKIPNISPSRYHHAFLVQRQKFNHMMDTHFQIWEVFPEINNKVSVSNISSLYLLIFQLADVASCLTALMKSKLEAKSLSSTWKKKKLPKYIFDVLTPENIKLIVN